MNELIEKYVEMWQRGLDFEGTSDVRDYWLAIAANFIVSVIIGSVFGVLRLGILAYLYGLACAIPGLALTIRRIRDTGREWFWIFINFVPCVGTILLIIMLTKPTASR